MNEFKNYHPFVNFIYFMLVIGYTMLIMHPLYLVVAFSCSFIYSAILGGIKVVKKNLFYMAPLLLIMALVNPLFNHKGATILWYFPNGNPLTLEAVIYGILASVMIVSVIWWFSCFNNVMSSDKFVYLFGRIVPSLSLIFSMTLRFVPRFSYQLKRISDSQRCIGRDISKGGILKRIKSGLSILSIMTTWALENAVETADSMKSRGYGLKGRTAFSIYRFDKRDKVTLLLIVLLSIYIFVGVISGNLHCSFYPNIKISGYSLYNLSLFVIYTIFCILPVIIELWEVKKWKHTESKI